MALQGITGCTLWRGLSEISTDQLAEVLAALKLTGDHALAEARIALFPAGAPTLHEATFVEWWEQTHPRASGEPQSRRSPRPGSRSQRPGSARRLSHSRTPSVMSTTSTGSRRARSEMLDAKMVRQRAEADMKLLANRLQHLQSEMERANKKIQQTRRRAQEIDKVKRSARDSAEERQRKLDAQRAREARLREQHLRRKREAQARKEANLQKALEEKRAAARRQREEQELHARRVAAHRAKQEKAKRDARRKIVEGQNRAVTLRRKATMQQREQQRLESQRRLEEERRRKADADRRIAELEVYERELIAKLRDSQAQQVEAFQRLEAVLAEGGDASPQPRSPRRPHSRASRSSRASDSRRPRSARPAV